MTAAADIVTDDYKTKYGFADSTAYLDQRRKGINEDVVKEISRLRNEPMWMEEFRLKALKHFNERQLPTWGVDLSPIKFQDFYYYAQPAKETAKSWDDVPPEIKNTFEKLGIAKNSREEKLRAREAKLKQDAENARMAKLYREHVLGEKPVEGIVSIDSIAPAKPAAPKKEEPVMGD